MIWSEFVRDATPEETKNAPGAATPTGQTKKEFRPYYEAEKKKVKAIGLELELIEELLWMMKTHTIMHWNGAFTARRKIKMNFARC